MKRKKKRNSKMEDNTMIVSYINAIEERLISDFNVSKGFSHSGNRGIVREHFIREFLNRHFSEKFSFGTGEIIDAKSKFYKDKDPSDGKTRNQLDIVMYDNNYPKLSLSGITSFLAESVIATIEVKSTLNESKLKEAIKAAQRVKELETNFNPCSISSGYIPPKIANYLVVYQCETKSMKTVFNWIKRIYKNEAITDQNIFHNDDHSRNQNPCKILDGIFILGQGFILFDNVPLPFIRDRITSQHSEWAINQSNDGNMAALFYHLLTITSNTRIISLNPNPYFEQYKPNVELERI